MREAKKQEKIEMDIQFSKMCSYSRFNSKLFSNETSQKYLIDRTINKTSTKKNKDMNSLDKISLRLYLGSKNDIEDFPEDGCIITKSSIPLTKLQSKLNQLIKVNEKNGNGNLGKKEDDF